MQPADPRRRRRLKLLLPPVRNLSILQHSTFDRAAELGKLGFQAADAMHLAAAEELNADVFLTCDDRLLRRAARCASSLSVVVKNPLSFVQELENGPHP